MRTMLSRVTTREDVLDTLSANVVEPTAGANVDNDSADTWLLPPANITPVSAEPPAMPRDRMTFSGTAVYRNNSHKMIRKQMIQLSGIG